MFKKTNLQNSLPLYVENCKYLANLGKCLIDGFLLFIKFANHPRVGNIENC